MKTGIFKLTEADRNALVDHLLRLKHDDRRLRFFAVANDDTVRNFAARLPIENVLGYFLWDRLIASALVVQEGPNTVEFAVAVDDEQRRRGFAQRLLEHCIRFVHADRMVLRHLSDNVAMSGVHRHLPSRRELSCGEVSVLLDLKQQQEDELACTRALCAAEAA